MCVTTLFLSRVESFDANVTGLISLISPLGTKEQSDNKQVLPILFPFEKDPFLGSITMGFLRLVVALWTLAVVVEAEQITLPWCKPPPATVYEPRVAKVGDTVVFEWAGEAHNAWIYPSENCFGFEGREQQEYLGEQPGVAYTFTSGDVGTNKTFACSLSNHCIEGQILTFSVTNKTVVDYDLSTPCGEGFLGDPPLISGGTIRSWRIFELLVLGVILMA